MAPIREVTPSESFVQTVIQNSNRIFSGVTAVDAKLIQNIFLRFFRCVFVACSYGVKICSS